MKGFAFGKLAIWGVIVAVVLGFGIYAVSTYTNLRNEGRRQELALTAEYKAVQVNYGQFRTSFYDQVGIAREKRDAMDKILVDAIGGRYDKPGSPQIDSGKLFSAIQEAYPDLKGLDIYDKILTFVQQGREKFAQDQQKLQRQIQAYNQWRTTGSFLHPVFAGWLFPSDSLEARIGDKVYRGQEALDKMSSVIVGADTGEIFDSGVDKPLDRGEDKR
jgi:hypothetical protein